MRKSEPTLIILSPAFPRDESETNWLPAQQLLIKELKRQFPQLNIIVLSFLYPYQKIQYSWYDVSVISFGGMFKRKLRRLILWRSVWRKLKTIKKENEVIGILSFWCGECALVGSWFAYWHKLKHFCWICGQDARKNNRFIKWMRPNPAELISISDFLIEEFSTNHRILPAHLIPIAIDKKMFPKFPPERDIDIIGVGSFSILKHYDRFVLVISELKERFPNIKAIHCGDGEDRENIKTLIKKLNLTQTILLMGETPHPEVISLMQRSKIFLHTSSYEGFGMVYLEALYAGAHVISYTKAMNQDIKNWYIVKTKEEMVAKALALLQTPNLPYERVLVYAMEDSAGKLMKLFSLNREK